MPLSDEEIQYLKDNNIPYDGSSAQTQPSQQSQSMPSTQTPQLENQPTLQGKVSNDFLGAPDSAPLLEKPIYWLHSLLEANKKEAKPLAKTMVDVGSMAIPGLPEAEGANIFSKLLAKAGTGAYQAGLAQTGNDIIDKGDVNPFAGINPLNTAGSALIGSALYPTLGNIPYSKLGNFVKSLGNNSSAWDRLPEFKFGGNNSSSPIGLNSFNFEQPQPPQIPTSSNYPNMAGLTELAGTKYSPNFRMQLDNLPVTRDTQLPEIYSQPPQPPSQGLLSGEEYPLLTRQNSGIENYFMALSRMAKSEGVNINNPDSFASYVMRTTPEPLFKHFGIDKKTFDKMIRDFSKRGGGF